jgi:hypothetical protein
LALFKRIRLFPVLIILYCGVAIWPAAEAAGLVNPSFETGTLNGWIGWPTPAGASVVTTTTAHAGQALARISFNGLNTIIQDVSAPALTWTTGTAYTLRAWYRYTTSKPADYPAMTLHYMDNGGALQGDYLTTGGQPGNSLNWQEFQISFTALNQPMLRISLRGGTISGAVGTALFDDVSIAESAAIDSLDIYLLMGQSNMVGMDQTFNAEDKTVNPRVFMLNPSNQWVPAIEPVHGVGVGPGLTFGKQMANHFAPARIGLVPLAIGSTPISAWVKGTSNYQTALTRAGIAQQHGTLKGILWHQGENDSYDEALAAAYAGQIKQLVKDLRTDLHYPNLPFVCGELGRFQSAAYTGTINTALMNLPNQLPAVGFANSAELTNMDAWHFDAPSARILGQRYFDAMLKLQLEPVSAATWKRY